MDPVGKSSKAQEKNDMESLGITFESIEFYPDRNEYELRIELSGCPKELIKATYEVGKLKVEGQKYQREFVQEFSIPGDCLPNRIYGLYEGEVLHIIMPRLLSEHASLKQEEYDRKAVTEADENRDGVKDLGGGIIKRANSSSRQRDGLNASLDRKKSIVRARTRVQSDQKATEDVSDKLLIRIPTLVLSDQNERDGKDHDKSLTEVPASLSSDEKEMKEQLPSPHATMTTPWNQNATKIREEENVKNEKIVNESNDTERSKVKKPSDDEGNKTVGLVAKVKETGKAAVSATKENRLVVMIGVVLTIVVLGASWRRKKKRIQVNM